MKKKKKTKAKNTAKPKRVASAFQKAMVKVETMDRTTLKTIAHQLKDMGADLKVLKSDTDDLLQKKVNEALQKMPSKQVLAKIDSIVPEKLVTILKRDCVGVFIDLGDASCIQCKDVATCAREYLKNLKGDMSAFQKAMVSPAAEAPPKQKAEKPKAGYDPDALVFVMNRKNPNQEGDDFHDTYQAILDEVPEKMSELRAIIAREFKVKKDVNFAKWVDGLRKGDDDGPMIKVVDDLSKKNRAELKEAGYEV